MKTGGYCLNVIDTAFIFNIKLIGYSGNSSFLPFRRIGKMPALLILSLWIPL